MQNEKEVEAYEERVERAELPLTVGHLLNEEDLLLRKNILELMCTGKTLLQPELLHEQFYQSAVSQLKELEEDALIGLSGDEIRVTAKGGIFIRNISSALDARLWRKRNEKPIFSKAI